MLRARPGEELDCEDRPTTRSCMLAVLADGERPDASKMREGAPEALDGTAMRVLVVEDDVLVRQHAVRLIRRFGHDVREACGGPEALRLLAGDPRCDILLSDVIMPGMSGGQLAQRARLLLPGLAIVFVTGHHADPLVQQLRREGGVSVLAKPYRSAALAAALRQAVGQRRSS